MKNGSGNRSAVIAVAVTALLATAAIALAFTTRDAPEGLKAKEQFTYAKQIEELDLGESAREVNSRLGPPERSVAPVGDARCFQYVVTSPQTRYNLCFDRRDRLVSKTPY